MEKLYENPQHFLLMLLPPILLHYISSEDVLSYIKKTLYKVYNNLFLNNMTDSQDNNEKSKKKDKYYLLNIPPASTESDNNKKFLERKRNNSVNKKEYDLHDIILCDITVPGNIHGRLLSNERGIFVDIRKYSSANLPLKIGIRMDASKFLKIIEYKLS